MVGLGNPGPDYRFTRHNAGFMLAERFGRGFGDISWEISHGDALWAIPVRFLGPVRIVMPQTYMNLSGVAVAAAMEATGVGADRLIVLHDDLDLKAGALKLKFGGGHGGHRGLKSIVAEVGTADFGRVRLGIGRPPEGVSTIDHVLGEFSPDEEPMLDAMLSKGEKAIHALLSSGWEAAMNTFNREERERADSLGKPAPVC